MRPIFALCYTSCRPECIGEVITLWNGRASLGDLEWVVSVDSGAREKVSRKTIEALAQPFPLTLCVQNEPPFNAVRGWNLAAAQSSGYAVIAVSDDFVPPFGWDKLLFEIEEGNWVDREAAILVHDGYAGDICTLPIITRARYDALGYLFYPGYESMYADTELTLHARQDGVLIDARAIRFEHRHPDCGKRKADVHDRVHGSPERYARGRKLFTFRRAIGFPIDDGSQIPIDLAAPVRELPATDDFAALLCVNQDDLCLAETADRLFTEGVRHFFFCIPDYFWSGKPSEIGGYDAIDRVAQSLRDRGAQAHVKIFRRADYNQGQPRAHLEGAMRNAMLDWINENRTSPHILVVDGDELWRPGLFNLIRQSIQADAPKAISSRMIPVAGQPGFPIAGAKDNALVYLSPGVRFKVCRTADVEQLYQLPGENIFHFTCTRRTHEKLIEKLKESSHYDDPSYAFDDWIATTLPRIKPGMAGAHMYRHDQIWPAVRSWTKLEAAEMPDGIKPFLGLQFSQNDEELVLLRIFNNRIHDDQPRGRFLDIGAYDGSTYSNTRRLADFGWGGVCVEPSPQAFTMLLGRYRKNPEIKLVHAAIGSGRLEVFHNSGGLVSSISDAHVAKWKTDAVFAPYLVRTCTVAELIDAIGVDFDFLNLDIEGENMRVFNELPDALFSRLHCVCVEHDGRTDEIINKLSPFGFQWRAQNAENVILAKGTL